MGQITDSGKHFQPSQMFKGVTRVEPGVEPGWSQGGARVEHTLNESRGAPE
jgi:hypothetical protein